MSVGRWIMRGRVFQPRVFAGWALANGGAIVIQPPNAGWIASTQQRHWTGTVQGRHWTASAQNRLWTAEEKQ